jgi:chromosome segregation ATPase
MSSLSSTPRESIRELFAAWTACAAELSAFYDEQFVELEALRHELSDSARRVAAWHGDACQQREAAEASVRQRDEMESLLRQRDEELRHLQEQVGAWQARFEALQQHSAEERNQWTTELNVLRRALEMQAATRGAVRGGEPDKGRNAEPGKERTIDRVVDALAARLSQLQSGADGG